MHLPFLMFCSFWKSAQQPIRNINNSYTLILVFIMPCAGNNHLGIGIPDLKQGRNLPGKSPFVADIIRYLYINLFLSIINRMPKMVNRYLQIGHFWAAAAIYRRCGNGGIPSQSPAVTAPPKGEPRGVAAFIRRWGKAGRPKPSPGGEGAPEGGG